MTLHIIHNINALGFVVSEKKIVFVCSLFKPMSNMWPQGGALWFLIRRIFTFS